jgi:hypothetical protein
MSRAIKPDVPRLALTQEEAAEALGMSVSSFIEHVKHDLPVVYFGSMRRYPVWGIKDLLHEQAMRGGRRVA